ncbi:MAG TPA: pentapeptide repeat-containing protein, partial [Phototrophicaceae bacterium]|nr:pentapeptide repeat-containing protein [Phototrophicaceae bacterium]
LFNKPIEVKRDNIFLYEMSPKYYQYPPKQYLSDIETHNYANNDSTNRSIVKAGKIKCYYNAKYYDTKKSQLVDFQCNEDALRKGFCIFHDDDASKGKENELDKTLNEKINKWIDDGQEVFCIGYNIPIVSLRGKKIFKPIYFHDAKIKIADFRKAIFTEEAMVYFVHTSFEEASFENAIFHSPVLFNNSTFSRNSDKQGFFHEWNEDYKLWSNYSGYADFRNAEFHGYADFNDTVFRGIAFFDYAKFFDDAIFTNSQFQTDKDKLTLDKASFYGKFYNKGIHMTNAFLPTD